MTDLAADLCAKTKQDKIPQPLEINITKVQRKSFLNFMKDNYLSDIHRKDQVIKVFQEFDSKWENVKCKFDTKGICTERAVTASHITQSGTMF